MPAFADVAGKYRRRLVKLLMARRFTAPEVVVIHRGQIVMDKRVGVDHLDGGCRCRELFVWCGKCTA